MKEDDIRNREVFKKYIQLSKKDIDVFFSDKSSFVTITCPACDSSNITDALSKNKFNYARCLECDTLFVNPRPSIETFNKYYQDSPSTSFWVNKFFLPVAEVRREKIFKPRAKFIHKKFSDQGNLKIGDIGSGFGIFLEELQKIWPAAELVAIEPSNEMADICRKKGLSVLENLFEELPSDNKKFDILTSFELFEHLFSPGDFVIKAHELLNNGGYIVLTTLNGLGFDIQLLWENSKSLNPPHHLNFFNPFSMEILFKRAGFRIVEISTPGVLDWDIVQGAIENENANPDMFFQTVSKYGTDKAKKELQEWITRNNFSSHMRIIAQKV